MLSGTSSRPAQQNHSAMQPWDLTQSLIGSYPASSISWGPLSRYLGAWLGPPQWFQVAGEPLALVEWAKYQHSKPHTTMQSKHLTQNFVGPYPASTINQELSGRSLRAWLSHTQQPQVAKVSPTLNSASQKPTQQAPSSNATSTLCSEPGRALLSMPNQPENFRVPHGVCWRPTQHTRPYLRSLWVWLVTC